MTEEAQIPVPTPKPFRLISSETVPLTKELAAEMRGLQPSPTERDLNPKRVQFLRERLLAGLFHPPHWVKAVVAGKTMRANGQHSSEMLKQCNGEFPEGLVVHVDTFECKTVEDLALLFRQFDDRKSARTPADVSGAYQGLQSDLNEVPRFVAKLGIEGIAWYRSNVQGLPNVPKGDDIYTLFDDDDLHPFLIWIGQIFSIKTPEMTKKPVIAAMFATYNVDNAAAELFWREVSRGGREYVDDFPSTTLDDWLRRVQEGEFEVKPHQLYQGSVYAWNAFRDGKESLRDIRSDIKKSLLRVI